MFLCFLYFDFINVCSFIVCLIVLFKFIGLDCLILRCMLKFGNVLIKYFLVSVLYIFFGVVGYVKCVKCLMFCLSWGIDLVVFCCFFLSCVLYSLVWLIGEKCFFRDLFSFLKFICKYLGRFLSIFWVWFFKEMVKYIFFFVLD